VTLKSLMSYYYLYSVINKTPTQDPLPQASLHLLVIQTLEVTVYDFKIVQLKIKSVYVERLAFVVLCIKTWGAEQI